MTISLDFAEDLTLKALKDFVKMAERGGLSDGSVVNVELTENNEIVGLFAEIDAEQLQIANASGWTE